jgi:hypothetical protein
MPNPNDSKRAIEAVLDRPMRAMRFVGRRPRVGMAYARLCAASARRGVQVLEGGRKGGRNEEQEKRENREKGDKGEKIGIEGKRGRRDQMKT